MLEPAPPAGASPLPGCLHAPRCSAAASGSTGLPVGDASASHPFRAVPPGRTPPRAHGPLRAASVGRTTAGSLPRSPASAAAPRGRENTAKRTVGDHEMPNLTDRAGLRRVTGTDSTTTRASTRPRLPGSPPAVPPAVVRAAVIVAPAHVSGEVGKAMEPVGMPAEYLPRDTAGREGWRPMNLRYSARSHRFPTCVRTRPGAEWHVARVAGATVLSRQRMANGCTA